MQRAQTHRPSSAQRSPRSDGKDWAGIMNGPDFHGSDAAGEFSHPESSQPWGFALVELMIALLILAIGLLAAGQPVFIAMSSASLARSKGVAALLAQNKLEHIGGVLQREPEAAEITDGAHGPEQVRITNPADGSLLNCFNVDWTVAQVPDLRAASSLNARLITVTVTPTDAAGAANKRPLLNKIVVVASVYGTGIS